MLKFFNSQKRIIAKCERDTPVFWVMHEIEDAPDFVQVTFLDRQDGILESLKMPCLPTHREATLQAIEKIRQKWVFQIC